MKHLLPTLLFLSLSLASPALALKPSDPGNYPVPEPGDSEKEGGGDSGGDCGFTGFLTSFECVDTLREKANVKEQDPVKFILSLLRVGLTLAGIIAVIALIISGVRYIISAGDEGEAKKAKSGIMYTVIGLVVIGASILIVNIIINAFVTP